MMDRQADRQVTDRQTAGDRKSCSWTDGQTDGSTFILQNGHKMHVVPEDGNEIVVGGGDNGGNIRGTGSFC